MTHDVVILCPGPSLSAFLDAPGACGACDLIIGVNRACAVHPCDVFAFGDAIAFETFEPIGTPILLTNRDALGKLKHLRERIDRHMVVTIDALAGDWPQRIDETTYTVVTAVAYAISQAATSITLFGCDHDGRTDFDGVDSLGPNRTDQRWSREATALRLFADFARDHGIGITGMPWERSEAAAAAAHA